MGMHVSSTAARKLQIQPYVVNMINKGLRYPADYVNKLTNSQKQKEKEHRSVMARFKELTFMKHNKERTLAQLPSSLYISSKTVYANTLKLKTREIRNKTFHDQQLDLLLEAFEKAKVIEKAPKLMRRKRKQMKIRVVLNADNTTRLIGYNRFINKVIKPFTIVRIPDPKKKLAGLLLDGQLKYLFKIDLKNGYFNAKINKESRQWFTFYWKDKLYWFRSMPIGQGDSVVRFQNLIYNSLVLPVTRQTQPFMKTIKTFTFSNYLDDLMGCCGKETNQPDIKEKMNLVFDAVVDTARQTMTNLNMKKSFRPTTRGNIMGFIIDTDLGKLFMSNNTMRKFTIMFEIFPTPYRNLFGLFNYYKEYLNVKDLVTFVLLQKLKRFFSHRYIWNQLHKLYKHLKESGFSTNFINWKTNYFVSRELSRTLDRRALYVEIDQDEYIWEKGVYATYLETFFNIEEKLSPGFKDWDIKLKLTRIREKINEMYMASYDLPKSKVEKMNSGHFKACSKEFIEEKMYPTKWKRRLFAHCNVQAINLKAQKPQSAKPKATNPKAVIRENKPKGPTPKPNQKKSISSGQQKPRTSKRNG